MIPLLILRNIVTIALTFIILSLTIVFGLYLIIEFGAISVDIDVPFLPF